MSILSNTTSAGKSIISNKDLGPDIHVLKFDGINNYVRSESGVMPQRNEPWTFFAKLKRYNTNEHAIWSSNYIFSTMSGIGFQFVGNLFFCSMGTVSERIRYDITSSHTINEFITVQLIYDPTLPNIDRGRLFVNNVEYFRFDGQWANTNWTSSQCILGRLGLGVGGAPNRYLNGMIKEVSFVNYIKTTAELTDDFNNGCQSQGSGSYLLDIHPIYPTDIEVLVSTVPFKERAQDLDMTIVNKPNPMALDMDFENIGKDPKLERLHILSNFA